MPKGSPKQPDQPPVRSDDALAQALGALELGSDVPEAMWRAVAEALAWAYRLDAEASRHG